MAGNNAPATVTVTAGIGPGLTATALKFTDVNDIEVDFLRNFLKVTRAGAGGIVYYDYSALGASITWTVANGVTTIVFT